MTFGIRRPVIILPSSFIEMSEDCREAILLHELMHIPRRDWLCIVVEETVRSLFWFHPAIWWLLGRIHLSREQLVDYEVVRLAGNRQPYLDSLLEFARAQARPRALPAPLFLKERHLVYRVAPLLKEVSMSRSRVMVSLAGVSILLIATVCFATPWFPLTGPGLALRVQAGNSKFQAPTADPIRIFGNAQLDGVKAAPVIPEQKALVPVSRTESAAAAPLPTEATSPAPEPAPIPAARAPGREPISVGGNVQESKLIYKVEPVYPEQAKNARITGTVVLTVTANEDGLVFDVKVVSGHPLLTDAAVSAVKQWRYSTTLLNGMPVPVVFKVTCIFNMADGNVAMFLMGQSGDLTTSGSPSADELMPKLEQGGTAIINITPGTPIRVAESVVQGLMPRGVQNIKLVGAYDLYQGKLFYTGKTTNAVQLLLSDELARRITVPPDRTGSGEVKFYVYKLLINEVGEIVGVQPAPIPVANATGGVMLMRPDEMRADPETERELMRTRVVAPGILGAESIPVVYRLEFTM